MFQVIDFCGYIYDAYGIFLDSNGDIQFILCRNDGTFFKTDSAAGCYRLYKNNT